MKEIVLDSGHVVLVDDEDYDRVMDVAVEAFREWRMIRASGLPA